MRSLSPYILCIETEEDQADYVPFLQIAKAARVRVYRNLATDLVQTFNRNLLAQLFEPDQPTSPHPE